MLEKAGQSDTIISQVRFLSDDHDVIFSPLRIELHELLAGHEPSQHLGNIEGERAKMNILT